MPALDRLGPLLKLVSVDGKLPPALTIGLMIFLPALYILNFFIPINKNIALSPFDLKDLELNHISFYPLGHLSIFHVVFNCIGLLTPLSQFERRNGTVYTGVMLNLLAVTTAIPYCLVGMFLAPHTRVLGASGWWFSFLAYFAFKESLIKPGYQITPTIIIPTIATPLIPLFLVAFFISNSSFLGHLFGLLSGYAMAFGFLAKIAPSSKPIEFIERKLDFLINLIPTPFKYYREVEAKEGRTDEYISILGNQSNILPISSTSPMLAATPSFQGEGQVLGAAV